jgi:hypothetical protein
MEKRIVYPHPDHDGVCMIIPAPGCGLPIEEIARKDTPAGVAYLIIDAAGVPDTLEFFDAWRADFSNPDGYGIGHDAWFAEQAAKGNDLSEASVTP